MSAWHGPGITDYSTSRPWGAYSGANNGHSLSLYRRTYYMAYMAGTGALIAEAGGVNFFLEEQDEKGYFMPSPLGLVGQEFYNFTQRHPDRGIPYTPFGVLLDYYHGTYMGGDSPRRSFDTFPYNSGDKMTWRLLEMFFPGGWNIREEAGTLTHSPYGDTCDVLLQNTAPEVLASYPVIIPSGDIHFSAQEVDHLVTYVEAGGVLLLNSAYYAQFPSDFTGRWDPSQQARAQAVGKGVLLLYGPDWNPAWIGTSLLRSLARTYLPVQVSSERVEYLITRRPASWVVTIINNRGVTKNFHDPPHVEPSQSQVVDISFTGSGRVTKVMNWLDDAEVPTSPKNSANLRVDLAPGDLGIFEFLIN